MRSAVTPADYRRISRWEHEDVLDRIQTRLDRMPEAGRLRRQTVEHAFGTHKSWMGATHLLTKTLPRVRTELSLHVLAYNLKRTIRMLGVQPHSLGRLQSLRPERLSSGQLPPFVCDHEWMKRPVTASVRVSTLASRSSATAAPRRRLLFLRPLSAPRSRS
jgi:hypothetical protein